jgi:hypothetical protein
LLFALLLVKILAQDACTPPEHRISFPWVIWILDYPARSAGGAPGS